MEQLREQLKNLLAEAQAWIEGLTEREQKLLGGTASAVFLFILFILFFSLSSTAASTRAHTKAKQLKLQEALGLAATYNDASRVQQDAERQLAQSNVSLLTYVEEKGVQVGLDVPTLNPKNDVPVGDDGKIMESSIELTLSDINLTKLLDFMNALEQGPGMVRVNYLRIEPKPASETLSAFATVSTYHLKGAP